MGDRSAIEWTDATWNPIRGCSRVSEGCRHCYAEQVAARFSGPGQAYEGLAKKVGGEARWTGNVRFIDDHLNDPLRWRKHRKIFVDSMSDLFYEEVPDEWIDKIFDVMERGESKYNEVTGVWHRREWHTFQVLTKRPERMLHYMNTRVARAQAYADKFKHCPTPEMRDSPAARWARQAADRSFYRNIWLGVSIENQKTADERFPFLLQTPAAVRFLSCEPLLGPIDLKPFAPFIAHLGAAAIECEHGYDACPICDRGIDWVIVGGESGPGYRPMDPAWLEHIVDQCQVCHVPVFVKQDSGSKPGKQGRIPDATWKLKEFPGGQHA